MIVPADKEACGAQYQGEVALGPENKVGNEDIEISVADVAKCDAAGLRSETDENMEIQ